MSYWESLSPKLEPKTLNIDFCLKLAASPDLKFRGTNGLFPTEKDLLLPGWVSS